MAIETRSETWMTIAKHIGSEIERIRDALENDSTPEVTAKHRADLRAYKAILALPDSLNEQPLTYSEID